MFIFKKLYQKLRSEKNGNVSIVAATTLPVVLAIGFGAIDYGNVIKTDQELKAAAAAAALAAVNEAQMAYSARENVDLTELIEDTASVFFDSRIAHIKSANISQLSITPAVRNNVFSVAINYSANIKSTAMSLVGRENFTVANSERAQVSVLSYINFNFLFDISASMGVGATNADMEIMRSAIGCAFSCHLGGNTSYTRARNAGATMRIDVARQAAEQAIDVMIAKSQVPEHMTVGLHVYDNILTSPLESTDALSSNLPVVRSQVASAVQMRTEYGGSNTEHALKELTAKLPQSGSGRTKDDRIQYIIVLTDGVENPQHWRPGRGWKAHPDGIPNAPFEKFANHEYEYAPNANSCDAANTKNIEVFFVNTEYLVPNWQQSAHNTKRFDFIENRLHDLIPQRMSECAGRADNVINASSPAEITQAFQKLVGDLSTPLRLF